MTRKEKAEARKKKREQGTISTSLPPQPAAINKPTVVDSAKIRENNEQLEKVMQSIAGIDNSERKPVDATVVSSGVAQSANAPTVEAKTAATVPTQAAVQPNTQNTATNVGVTAKANTSNNLPNVAIQPKAQATVQNPIGLSPNAGVAIEKPKTIADLIAEGYKKVEKEKTDAAKMQKYYALSDAFSALGRMGGAAIGGAIGGDVLGSAPVVPEYKESRGYIDAFERAKKANDRIKELDNMSYQLALRDEDRKLQKATAEEERAFNLKVLAIKNQYEKDRDLLHRKWQVADNEGKKALELEIQAKDQQFKKDMAALGHQYNIEEAVVKSFGNAKPEDTEYIQFMEYKDVTSPKGNATVKIPAKWESLSVPKDVYDSMMLDFVAQGRKFPDGTAVTKETAESYIRSHPKEVKTYLEEANRHKNRTNGNKNNDAQSLVDAI